MRRVDQEALRRAVRLTRADEVRDAQIARKLANGQPWESVAKFCAYHQQCSTLRLRPWQQPPCHSGDDEPVDRHPSDGRVAAWQLRARLLAAGLSQYEPDPIRALHEVEEAAKQTGAR